MDGALRERSRPPRGRAGEEPDDPPPPGPPAARAGPGSLPRLAARTQIRVLAVVPGQPDERSMPFVHHQIRSLRASGVDVEAFYLRSRTSPRRLARDLLRVRRLLRDTRPDLVHAQYGTVTAAFAALATAGSKIPLVITFRGNDLHPEPGEPVQSLARRALSHAAALRAEGIICVSPGLARRLWWGRSRAVIIPSGVDLDMFRPCPKAQARADIGLPEAGRIVLFNAGSSPRRKREDLARAAVDEASRHVGPVQLLVLDGKALQPRVAALMNAADALLFTSVREGSPNVVKEALACNLPVVAVDAGDVAERLRGVEPSFLVPAEPGALGAALAELLRRPVRSNGRAAVEPLGLERVAQRVVEVYERAAGPAPRGRAPVSGGGAA